MSDSKNEDFRSVKVLYDYNYTDTDSGEEVYMYVDEEFILLQETNDEWWEVCRPNEQVPFFVPAQYVTIIDTPLRTDFNFNEENDVTELTAEDEGEVDYANLVNNNDIQSDKVKNVKDKPEVTYANLQEIRASANIPEPKLNYNLPVPPNKLNLETESPSGEYANLAFIQSSIHPPAVEQGDFVEVLCEPLPWDVYKDRYSKRLFYHNRDTDECMWKPPRKGKSPSSPPPEKLGEEHVIGEKKLGLPPEPKVRKSLTNDLFDEYEIKTENGEEIHVNRISKEKFKKTEDGKFINIDTREKHSELPSNRNDKKVKGQGEEKSNGEVVGTVTNKSFTTLPRSSKSTSLYGNDSAFKQNLEQHLAKSSTLPPNFSPAPDTDAPLSVPSGNPAIPHSNITDPVRPSSPSMVKSASSPTTTASSYRQEPNKPLCGYIMTSKISEVGKKVKKNWGQAYLVLKQSNLVFYKDEKATNQKQPGSPHGKTELVLNLQGAKIDINPRDITSKKNVILLATSNGSKFLLQSDEETIYRWFTEMKLVSGDIENEKRPSSREDKKGSGMTRSMSAEDGSSGRKLWDIRAKLLGLMRSRPAQEDLVKRGIIKDLVFGSGLKDLCEKEHTKIPNFVRACISAVEKRGLDHDGIYRVSGNLAEIQKLRYAVDKEEAYNLDDKVWDMNVLTGALKLFFRELKEPLIPPEYFDRFAAAVCKDSYKEKLKGMKEVVPDLPKCNYETMKFLFQHLTSVIKESKKNRMQAHNLAIVFGPTLSWKDDADASNMAVLTVYQSRIVEFMLMEFENLFK